jgi:hypothetical protein
MDEKGNVEKRAQALCGLRPRHGWGMDLFIEDVCSRCEAIMDRREAAGDEFIDIPEKLSEERKKAEYAAFLAEEAAEGRTSRNDDNE